MLISANFWSEFGPPLIGPLCPFSLRDKPLEIIIKAGQLEHWQEYGTLRYSGTLLIKAALPPSIAFLSHFFQYPPAGLIV